MIRYLPVAITSTITFLLILIYFQPLIFITIHAGEEGVLYRRFAEGTVTDHIYKEGFHIVCPWDVMTIYDTRIQQKTYSLVVLSAEGLKTELELSIIYYPRRDTLGVLHQKIGKDYLEKIVIPQIDHTVRVIVGKMTIDDLYTSKAQGLQELITESIAAIEKNYVAIDNVILRKITLPKQVEKSIETKIEQKQLAEAYQYKIQAEKQEIERKRLEAEGIENYHQIVEKSLTNNILKWKGIQATEALAKSNNAKIVVIGNNGNQLPIILGGEAGK